MIVPVSPSPGYSTGARQHFASLSSLTLVTIFNRSDESDQSDGQIKLTNTTTTTWLGGFHKRAPHCRHFYHPFTFRCCRRQTIAQAYCV